MKKVKSIIMGCAIAALSFVAHAQVDILVLKKNDSIDIKNEFSPYEKACEDCKKYKLDLEKYRLGTNFDKNMEGKTVWLVRSGEALYAFTKNKDSYIFERTYLASEGWTKEKAYPVTINNGEVFIDLDSAMTERDPEDIKEDVTSMLRLMNNHIYSLTGEKEVKNKEKWQSQEVKG